MDREGLSRIYLSYWGSAPPSAYGIAYQYAPSVWTVEYGTNGGPPSGEREIFAVSVVNLQWEILWQQHPYYLDWLRGREPIAKIGYSIYLYDITGDVPAHLGLAGDYIKAGLILPQAQSEIAKVLLLDPSNAEAKSLAASLHLPTVTTSPAGTGKIPPRIAPTKFSPEPQQAGLPLPASQFCR